MIKKDNIFVSAQNFEKPSIFFTIFIFIFLRDRIRLFGATTSILFIVS